MKNNKFKDNKYTCDYCNTSNFISSYLVRDKCVICNKELSRKLKRKMRKVLKKGFIKRSRIYEETVKRYEKLMKKRLLKYIYGNDYK